MKRFLKSLCVLFMLSSICIISGCGLHLRGMGDSDADKIHYKSVQLLGSEASLLYRILYTKINALGVKIVDVPDSTTLILRLGSTKFDKVVVSVDSRAQEVEYAMSAKTIYFFSTVNTKPQKRLSGFTRSLFNKNDEVLASDNEALMIQNELIQQTAEDIYIQFLRQK